MEAQQVRDVITYKPKFIKFIRDTEIIELIKDKNHLPILKLLKQKPMTVRDLEKGYEEETGKAKSNKTIYRYLKTLEEAQLVIPAGNRVETGKTATETIYARTALAFYMKDDEEKYWKSNKSLELAKNVSAMLKPLFGEKCNTEQLKDLMTEFSMNGESMIESISKEHGEELAKLLEDTEFDDISNAIKFTSMFAAIKAMPDLLGRIESCFE